MIRGAVYPVDLGDAKRGHEQRGRRLGLVISIEQNAWSTVTIIPTSTSAQPAVFRPDVIITGRDTRILIDQIRTIDTAYVTGELVDYLSRDDMAQVEHSLSRYLGLLRLQRSRAHVTSETLAAGDDSAPSRSGGLSHHQPQGRTCCGFRQPGGSAPPAMGGQVVYGVPHLGPGVPVDGRQRGSTCSSAACTRSSPACMLPVSRTAARSRCPPRLGRAHGPPRVGHRYGDVTVAVPGEQGSHLVGRVGDKAVQRHRHLRTNRGHRFAPFSSAAVRGSLFHARSIVKTQLARRRRCPLSGRPVAGLLCVVGASLSDHG
jgi:mRNA interferase MazF